MQYFGNYVISWERSWFATHFVHMYTIFRLLYRYVLYNVIIVYKTCIQQSVRIILYAFQATIHLKILRILGSLLVIGTPRWRRIYGDKWVRWPSTSGSGVISIIIIVDEPFFFFVYLGPIFCTLIVYYIGVLHTRPDLLSIDEGFCSATPSRLLHERVMRYIYFFAPLLPPLHIYQHL